MARLIKNFPVLGLLAAISAFLSLQLCFVFRSGARVFSFVGLILSLSALGLGSYGFARALFSKSLNFLVVVLFLLDFLLGMLFGFYSLFLLV